MKKLRSKSKQTFLDKVLQGDPELAKVIIDEILNNLDSEESIVVTHISFEEEEESFECSCSPDSFIVTLAKNLKVLVAAEAYEDCSKVIAAMKYLESKI